MGVYERKNVAVISKRKRIADFFLLEAQACGCYASEFEERPNELSGFDLILTDNEEKNAVSVVKITEGDRAYEELWELPIPIERLRRLYLENIAVADKKADTQDIFYVLENEKSIIYQNKKITLTEGEWKSFELLAAAEGEPVSRQRLMELFGAEQGNIADVYVCRLRRKLEEPFGLRLIATVRGKGYAFLGKIER